MIGLAPALATEPGLALAGEAACGGGRADYRRVRVGKSSVAAEIDYLLEQRDELYALLLSTEHLLGIPNEASAHGLPGITRRSA
jgi:hypothetical protein